MNTRYIPALSFKQLTPLYDPLLKWVMREERSNENWLCRQASNPAWPYSIPVVVLVDWFSCSNKPIQMQAFSFVSR